MRATANQMTSNRPILYGTLGSPTVRAALLTLKALKVDYEFRVVDLIQGEHLSAEYAKKNAAHTIPALEIEPGRYIGDSHAIMAYLVGKYGKKDDPLYPKELYKRAKVDEMLHFEGSVIFIPCVKQVLSPIFRRLRNDVPAEKLTEIENAFKKLETHFGDHAFVAGNEMTIADFSCVASVATLLGLPIKQIDEEEYPKIYAWLTHMRSLPYYEDVMENETVLKIQKFLNKQLSKL